MLVRLLHSALHVGSRVHTCVEEIRCAERIRRASIYGVAFILQNSMALFRYFKKEKGNLPDNDAAGVYGGVVYTARPLKSFPRNSLNFDFHENFAPQKTPAIRYDTYTTQLQLTFLEYGHSKNGACSSCFTL